ncbi:MAG: hypothetical protein M3N82_15595, partial [Pseudomonadota bacterium]|nr:hypothetical protein [Pseudomonadota bacterium]
DRRRLRHVVGHPRHVYEGSGRGPLALRGRVSSNAQGNRGRSGPISDGRTPKKQAPAHPAAARPSASAKRKTQNAKRKTQNAKRKTQNTNAQNVDTN